MPIFAIQNDTDFDANSEVGNISGGVMSGLVASGAFEVSTTEFKTPATYNPNDTLTAGLNGGGDAGLVLLSGGNYSDTVICGIVSRGVTSGVAVDNNDLLHFWTVYGPAIRASGLV